MAADPEGLTPQPQSMPGVVVRARRRAHGSAVLQLETDAGVVTSGRWLRLVTPVLSGEISVPELKGSEQFTVLTPDPESVRGPSGGAPCLARSSPRGVGGCFPAAGRWEPGLGEALRAVARVVRSPQLPLTF